MIKHLRTEYRMLAKPGPKKLFQNTFRILGASLLGAAVLWALDTGFGAVLGLLL